MPLRGVGHSGLVGDEAPYFDSLAELDAWFTQPRRKLTGVLPYQPRPHIEGQSNDRGKLLVCHDYKGGYTESPSGQCYTFNFWSLCDTFVYFSHHRVTIPPSGWTNAAHKQGVKILGTLILEHSESNSDGMKLILGNIPNLSIGSSPQARSIPLSRHYASCLAEIAFQRGFDGYLLNFESSLPGGSEQARALAAWFVLLRAELHTKVGPHSDVVWYDSVTISGQLKYQNRLNHYNLPFFIASDAFFTNYFWSPHYPSIGASYFLNIDPILLSGSHVSDNSSPRVKTLGSVFVGVDVWGRHQYGGGGLNSYRAITHIDPQSLGLSVALFGPGWTWESEQDKPGWSWEQWWQFERQLWIGPSRPDEVIHVPEPPKWPYGPEQNEGPFKPIHAFFGHAPPPDPLELSFYTCFSPGVGRAWFVNGANVLEAKQVWTDIDKQCSIGNLVWPRPLLHWEGGELTEDLPLASTGFDMTDGWNGGNSLKLSVIGGGSSSQDAFFRCVWIPVQSLTVTLQESYEVCVVYKTSTGEGCDLDLAVNVKSLSAEGSVSVEPAILTDLRHGWSQQTLNFTVTSPGFTSVVVGLIAGFTAEDPAFPCTFTISLGKLAVYPSPLLPPVSVALPSISWASFTPSSAISADSLGNLAGVLTWDTAISLPPMNQIPLEGRDPEDPRPAWILDNDQIASCPSFIHFNIYIAVSPDSTDVLDPSLAIFIGTTGLDGRGNRFYVEPQCLPEGLEGKKAARFYVQGVSNRGEVLPWDRCAHVDYKMCESVPQAR